MRLNETFYLISQKLNLSTSGKKRLLESSFELFRNGNISFGHVLFLIKEAANEHRNYTLSMLVEHVKFKMKHL